MRAPIAFLVIAVLLVAHAAHAQRPSLQPSPELVPEPRPPAAEAPPAGAPITFATIDLSFRRTTTSGNAAAYERYRDLRTGSWSRLTFDKTSDTYLFTAATQNIG